MWNPPASFTDQSGDALRVVHVASGDLWAGAEVQLCGLAKEQRSDPEVAPFVVLLNDGAPARYLRESGVPVFIVDETRAGPLRILSELIRLLRGIRPHVVQTHREKENVVGSIAAFLARVPVSCRTIHGAAEEPPGPWEFRRRLQSRVDRWCGMRLQKEIVAVSPPLAQQTADAWRVGAVACIENGIDLSGIDAVAPKALPMEGDERLLRLAFVGRLVPVKRLDIAIEVMRLLMREQVPARLYVFGDGPLRREMGALACNRGVGEQVRFMGFRSDVAAYLRQMHLMLVLSDHEGLPTNVLEAGALGIPVISHGVGGIPKVLGEGRFGTLCGSQDPEEYAAAVRAYVANPSPYLEKAAAARARVRADYGMGRVAEQYKALYRRALRPTAPSGRPKYTA